MNDKSYGPWKPRTIWRDESAARKKLELTPALQRRWNDKLKVKKDDVVNPPLLRGYTAGTLLQQWRADKVRGTPSSLLML